MLLKYHGGKSYLASTIVKMMRPHRMYVEPFFGAGSVFFAKGKLDSELSDINPEIINFWMHVKTFPFQLKAELLKLEYSQRVFLQLKSEGFEPNLRGAVRTFAMHRMSRGGLGEDYSFSVRLRGNLPEGINAWNSAIDSIDWCSDHLVGVRISRQDAYDVLYRCLDATSVLMYLDPPYVPDTRVSPNAYAYEMTLSDHERMIELLKKAKCKVLLSGYHNPLYKSLGWICQKFEIANHSGQTEVKNRRTECVWRNYM
jgi:DNA adenine methylase